ncbi:hypothetical protein [Endozoicomonas sp. 4G]|uniref:hypothetical protein n=1 Tax=Endozoicomonas sp. 4G TaxID=2872754 RepID=UPI0020791CA8|nr:hypothetical protein [Endozoicomonas sp. 4G]
MDVSKPVVVTQNEKPLYVVQDPVQFEMQQEQIALLRLLSFAEKDVQAGRKRSFEDVFKNHNLTASLSPANNAGDAKHESTNKTLYPSHPRTVAADY